MRVSVVIPTYQGDRQLAELLRRLRQQSFPPAEIIVVDSSSTDRTAAIATEYGCLLRVIPKASFNHGGTRNLGASLATGDILIFMTQDALPVDDRFVEELTQPIRDGFAIAAYSRQVPYADAPPTEVFARNFNYPPVSHLRSQADIPAMGIKAVFFSNVASCVQVDAFRKVKGFPESVILNEDMLLCAKLLRIGGTVSYQAEAKVFHSHRYRLAQQFKRYFDIGVAVTEAGELLDGATAGGEGVKFALRQLRYLMRGGAWTWVPHTVMEIGVKYAAYQLGKRHRFLNRSLKRKLSMHSFYWDTSDVDAR